jgi:hypothetical protein
MNPDIINAVDLVVERDIKYTKPKINKSGGKSINILNGTVGKPINLMLATPLMLTWGINDFTDEATGKRTYDMSLQFPQEEFRTEATDKFLKAMNDFQDKIKADAIINSKEWMNKGKLTPEVVDALFNPMLKYSKDPATGEPNLSKSPSLRIKVDYWKEAFTCEIYGTDGRLLFPLEGSAATPSELVPKACEVALVIQCGGLWFANGKFGVTWKLVQAVVKPKASLKGKCLLSFGDSNTAAPQQSKVNSSAIAVPADRPMEIVDESDEEEEIVTSQVTQIEDEDDNMGAQDVHDAAAFPTPTPAQVAAAATEEPPTKVLKKIVRKAPAAKN